MIASRIWPLERIVSVTSRCEASSGVADSSSAMPITPFIGVRISWLMLARNWLLARLAASARAVAPASAAVRSRTRSSSSARVAVSAALARSRSSQRRAHLDMALVQARDHRFEAALERAHFGRRARIGRTAPGRAPRPTSPRLAPTSCSSGPVTRAAVSRTSGMATTSVSRPQPAVSA